MRAMTNSLYFSVALLFGLVTAQAQLGRTAPAPLRLVRPGVGSTNFNPNIHGFRFVNDFVNDVVPSMDIRTGGLCGGMSYTVLDYYFAHKPIPEQDYRPANRTVLQSYLYNREVQSLLSNLDKWGEVGFNPGGARNSEFFNWGLQGTNGGRLEELRSYIDRGTPAVIDLQGDGGTGNHQVVAIGYNMGRYQGDLKNFESDLKITVYDPNYPMQVRTLTPDVSNQLYRYQEGGNERWRTYFVDKKYQPMTPPNLPNPVYPNDGTAHELILSFHTAADDLRGGNDNLNLTVTMMDGSKQFYPNINLSARWLPNYTENARIVLSRAVQPKQIRELTIADTFGGAMGGDNWDMQNFKIRALGGNLSQTLQTAGAKRFTGDDKQLVVSINRPVIAPGQVAQLLFEIHTGDDDLRGGNDNLNLEIHFADGSTQYFPNANHGTRWGNNSVNTVAVALDRPVAPSQIKSIALLTTFSGGMGGDNWNMNSLRVTATGNSVNKMIASYQSYRFTGSSRQLNVAIY